MLTRADARERFADLRAVVVDEWHELLGTKRGVQAELALARLRTLAARVAHVGALRHARQPRRGARAPCSACGRRRAALVRGRGAQGRSVDRHAPPASGSSGSRGRATSGSSSCRRSSRRSRKAHDARLHQHALADGALVSGDLGGAAGLGRRDRAAPRLARPRRARLGRGGACATAGCAASSARRASISASISRRSTGCSRSAAPRASPGCSSAPAAAATSPGAVSRVTCVPDQRPRTGRGRRRAHAPRRPGASRAATPVERPLDVLAQHARHRRRSAAASAPTSCSPRSARPTPTATSPTPSGSGCSTSSPAAARRCGPTPSTAGSCARGRRLRRARRAGSRAGTGCRSAPSSATRRSASSFLRGGRLGTVEESFIARLKPGDSFIVRRPRAGVRPRARDDGVGAAAPSGRRRRSRAGSAAGCRSPASWPRPCAASSTRPARGTTDPEMARRPADPRLQARWSRIPRRGRAAGRAAEDARGPPPLLLPVRGPARPRGVRGAARVPAVAPAAASRSRWPSTTTAWSSCPPTRPRSRRRWRRAASPAPAWPTTSSPSLNAAELARRQFREIARVAGLVFHGLSRAAQASPAAAGVERPVLRRLQPSTTRATCCCARRAARCSSASSNRPARAHACAGIARPRRVTDSPGRRRWRSRCWWTGCGAGVSSETLADRVRRMTAALEQAAG